MKQVIMFVFMAFSFSIAANASSVTAIKTTAKKAKTEISKKITNKAKPNPPACVTTQIPGGYYYACTAVGVCQSNWPVSACINNGDGTCTTLSMVYVQ